ncbi:MAG: hypothetical protein NTW11_01135 [Candidatus Staskawiczbacteria bacterium]|nr:hypothetical protein [Candidatus Staskawiczbacteria bacterium]
MSLSQGVMLAIDMNREALLKVNGGILHGMQVNMELGSERPGRSILDLRKDPYFDAATKDETIRVITFNGSAMGRNGWFRFTSICIISNFVQKMWDPWFVDVKIEDSDKLRFTYVRDHEGLPVMIDWHAVSDDYPPLSEDTGTEDADEE